MKPIYPGVNGGLYGKKNSFMPDMARPTNYISVESVEEYSKKVVSLGGKIAASKIGIPSFGWWALAFDPEGNHFGILEYI